jgi:hypothetical protein
VFEAPSQDRSFVDREVVDVRDGDVGRMGQASAVEARVASDAAARTAIMKARQRAANQARSLRKILWGVPRQRDEPRLTRSWRRPC